MNSELAIALTLQVRFQCRATLAAQADMNRALGKHQHLPFWIAAQNFLGASANISKTLWGVNGTRAAARAGLRQWLGVADSSCLRPRTVRNHFEHFDERVETALATGWTGFEDLAFKDLQPTLFTSKGVALRRYDPRTQELAFGNDRFSVIEIVQEVRMILPQANEILGISKP